MKINNVKAFLLAYPFERPIHLSYHGGNRTIFKRDAMLIRVETDNGLVGYAPGQGTERSRDSIDQVISPLLEGRTLGEPDALRVLFLAGPGAEEHVAKTYCSVEIALYDIVGKARSLPVTQLNGGRVRDRILLYGSAGKYMPPEK